MKKKYLPSNQVQNGIKKKIGQIQTHKHSRNQTQTMKTTNNKESDIRHTK